MTLAEMPRIDFASAAIFRDGVAGCCRRMFTLGLKAFYIQAFPIALPIVQRIALRVLQPPRAAPALVVGTGGCGRPGDRLQWSICSTLQPSRWHREPIAAHFRRLGSKATPNPLPIEPAARATGQNGMSTP